MHTSIEYTGCTNVYRMYQCIQDNTQCIQDELSLPLYHRIIHNVYSIQDESMYTGCTNVYRIIHNVYSIQYTVYRMNQYRHDAPMYTG